MTEVLTPSIDRNPDEDYETTMPCELCGTLIIRRYRCTCKNEYNYCFNQNHNWFWCDKCEEERKVDIMDMPRRAGNELIITREQREKADEIFGKLMNPDTAAKEIKVLKGIYNTWNDDPELWQKEAKERIRETNPLDKFAQERKTLSEFTSINSGDKMRK